MTFLEVASMVVTWWIVAFLRSARVNFYGFIDSFVHVGLQQKYDVAY